MKYYVQNGKYKKELTADDEMLAACSFFVWLSKNTKEENVPLSPITIVSQAGFMKSIEELNLEKEYDDISIIHTVDIFKELELDDEAEKMIEWEKENCKDDPLLKLLDEMNEEDK